MYMYSIMPKDDIDYSNTIIYKITCNDPTVTDKYVGHTTNFVQRKHAHKQSSCNEKNAHSDTKLYQTIRNHGGWTNWKMEIVGFYDCKNHYEARVKEQEHYVALQANLNSIEPLKPPKVVIPNEQRRETKVDYKCDTCNYKCANKTVYEKHLLTRKHEKNLSNDGKQTITGPTTPVETADNTTYKESGRFTCEKCDYKCDNKFDFNRHLSTRKHLMENVDNANEQNIATSYDCINCGNTYKYHSGLCKHRKTCTPKEDIQVDIETCDLASLKNIIVELIESNNELRKQSMELHTQVLELCKDVTKNIN